jgi:hypothetical protein
MGPEEHIYRVVVEVEYRYDAGPSQYEDETILLKAETKYLTDIHRVFYEWVKTRIEGRQPEHGKFHTVGIEKIEYVGKVVNP